MHPFSKNDNSSAVARSSRRFSKIYIAPLSARRQAGRDSFGSIARSTYAVRCTIEPVVMRLAAGLSGIRGSVRRNCSASPSHTMSTALSIANSTLPTGTSTTFIAPSSAMRTPTPAKSDISPGVGTCRFGAKTTVLPGLRCMPLTVNSCLLLLEDGRHSHRPG